MCVLRLLLGARSAPCLCAAKLCCAALRCVRVGAEKQILLQQLQSSPTHRQSMLQVRAVLVFVGVLAACCR